VAWEIAGSQVPSLQEERAGAAVAKWGKRAQGSRERAERRRVATKSGEGRAPGASRRAVEGKTGMAKSPSFSTK